MKIRKIKKYTLLTEDFFDDENLNDVVVQNDDIAPIKANNNYKFEMCIVLGFNNLYIENVSDLYDLKKQIIRIIKRVNAIYDISPCISSYEIEDTNIENIEPEKIDYRVEYEINIHFNTKPRKSIIPFLKFLEALVYLTKYLSGPKVNTLGVIVEHENDEIDYDHKISSFDFYKRKNYYYVNTGNEVFIKTLEMLSMIKYDDFYDEFNEYFGYDNITKKIYSMLSEKGKTEHFYRSREYELKDYSKIEKFCNSFIDIAIEDKQSSIFNFDNIFFKNKYSTITDMMSYDKKIKTIQDILKQHDSDKLKMRILFFMHKYNELHMYITFNKTCKISWDRYYAAPRLIINSSTEPENIVKFFKPLFEIGLSDKDCFNVIEASNILSGSKYSANRKKIQSELKRYYDSNK